jgi:large subunit ribosomal protein L35
MPKMKSHKGFKRRMRVTRNGKIVRTTCGVRHLLAGRTPKTKRNRRAKSVSTAAPYVKRAIIALSPA